MSPTATGPSVRLLCWSKWKLTKAFLDGARPTCRNDCELAIAALVDALARYLEGNDVPQIAQFRHNAVRATLQTGLHFSCAVAGIETALWDLQGKAQAQPVYQLLGGACREAVPVYANCHANKDFPFEDVIDYARGQHEAGFNRVKVYPF